MTPLTLALVAAAGGLGAVARFGLDQTVRKRLAGRPLGIFTVNVMASVGVGVIIALSSSGLAAIVRAGSTTALTSEALSLVLVSGLLGGFSTFSTVMVDAVLLGRAHRWGWFCVSTLGMFAASLAAFLAASHGLAALLS